MAKRIVLADDTTGEFSGVVKETLEADFVKQSGNQTIDGVKTFSEAPSVPNDSFAIAKTTGLSDALTSKASKTYVDGAFVTDVAGKSAGSVTARNVREGLGLAVNPVDFGAVGNGTTNDSAAVQAAITWLEANGGGDLVIPRGKRFKITDGIFLVRNSTVPVSLIGQGGALVGGTVTVGPVTPVNGGVAVHGMRIQGVEFDGLSSYGTLDLLVIGGVRGLTIADENYFRRGNKAIATYGDNIGDTAFHSLAMLRINKNRFNEVKFAVFHGATVWDYASDWDITDNFVNYASDTAYWIASTDGSNGGVDGLNFQGNVMFHVGVGSVGTTNWDAKRYCLRVGKVDWLRIINNNFFESGLETIYLKDCRNMSIVGNNIAWAGDKEKSAAIRFDESTNLRGTITGNTISKWSFAAISFTGATNTFEVELGDNELYFEQYYDQYRGPHTNWRVSILGAPTGGVFRLNVNGVQTADIAYNTDAAALQAAINAVSPGNLSTVTGSAGVFAVTFASGDILFRNSTSSLTGGTNPSTTTTANFDPSTQVSKIYSSGATFNYPNLRNFHYASGAKDSIRSSAMQTRDAKTDMTGIAGGYKVTTVPTQTTIFTLSDMLNVGARAGGLINILVRRSGGANDMCANYLLFVSAQSATCTVIASGGRTTGASADEPSFTWAIDTAGALKATRVGSTAGGNNFVFEATSLGTIQIK